LTCRSGTAGEEQICEGSCSSGRWWPAGVLACWGEIRGRGQSRAAGSGRAHSWGGEPARGRCARGLAGHGRTGTARPPEAGPPEPASREGAGSLGGGSTRPPGETGRASQRAVGRGRGAPGWRAGAGGRGGASGGWEAGTGRGRVRRLGPGRGRVRRLGRGWLGRPLRAGPKLRWGDRPHCPPCGSAPERGHCYVVCIICRKLCGNRAAGEITRQQ
jgi:hypothetical protein